MKKYQITKEDLQKVIDFVNATSQFHYPNGRSSNRIIEDIIFGKLGEVAYKRMIGDAINEINLISSEDPDPGWDFVASEGDRIQVKTVKPGFRWISFTNYYWDRLVVIQIDGNMCTLLLDKHITDIKRIAEKSKFKGWYIPSHKI
jgi:hypothetical protein